MSNNVRGHKNCVLLYMTGTWLPHHRMVIRQWWDIVLSLISGDHLVVVKQCWYSNTGHLDVGTGCWNSNRLLMHQGASPLNPCSCGEHGALPQTPLHIRAFGWGYMVIISIPRGQPLEPLLLQRAWGIAQNPTPAESWGCAPPQTMLHNFSYFPVPFPDCRALLSCHSTQYFTKHPQTLYTTKHVINVNYLHFSIFFQCLWGTGTSLCTSFPMHNHLCGQWSDTTSGVFGISLSIIIHFLSSLLRWVCLNVLFIS